MVLGLLCGVVGVARADYLYLFSLPNDGGGLTFAVSTVPEPGTYALMGLGLDALAFARRRSRRG